MASLLGWLGGAAKRVQNTVNNDIVKPIQRDVVQPIRGQSAPAARPNVIANARYGIQGAGQNVHSAIGIANRNFIQPAQHIAGIGPEDLRAIAGIATHNDAATRAALLRGHQDLAAGATIPRAIAQSGVRFGISTLDTIPRANLPTFRPTNRLEKFAVGNAPIHSYRETGKQGQGQVALTALGDALNLAGTATALERGAGALSNAKTASAAKTSQWSQFRNLSNETRAKVGTPDAPARGVKGGIAVNNSKLKYLNNDKGSAGMFEPLGDGKKPALTAADVKQLQKQGYDDKTIAKIGTPPTGTPKVSTPKIPFVAPVKDTPALIKAGLSKGGLIERNVPELAARANRQVNAESQYIGTTLNRTSTLSKLKAGDQQIAKQIIEGKLKPDSVSPQIQKAVKEIQSETPGIQSRHAATGAKNAGVRQNYFPRAYDWKAIDKNPGLQRQIAQQLMDAGKVKSIEEGLGTVKRQGQIAKSGNLSSSRTLDLPGAPELNPAKAWERYVRGAAKATTQAEAFGPKGEIATKLFKDAAARGGADVPTAMKAFDQYLNPARAGKASNAVLKGWSVTRLGTAAISHIPQIGNTAANEGLLNTGKGFIHSLSPGERSLVRDSGVLQDIKGLTEQEGSSRYTAPGLGNLQKVYRTATALAGKYHADNLAAKGGAKEVNALREMGVTGDIGKTLTNQQHLEAMQGATKKSFFRSTPLDTPLGAESTTGRFMGQARLAYGYKQTGVISDLLQKARKGNVAPLARFLGVSLPLAGAVAVPAKNLISGRDTSNESTANKVIDIAERSGALGLPGSIANGFRYVGSAKGGLDPGKLTTAVAGTASASLGDASKLTQAIATATGGNTNPLKRYGAGIVPIAGPRLGQAVAPITPPPPKTTASGQLTPAEARKQSTKIKTDMGTHPTEGQYDYQQLPNGHYAVRSGNNVTEYPTVAKAHQAVAKELFGNERGSYKVMGDQVLRKASDGTISVISKDKFNYQIGTATLTSQKNAGDFKGWLKTAGSQLDSINRQLQDPNIDPLDALTLQNEATAIQNNAAKYQSYGGFTKPKAARKASLASFKTPSVKVPKITSIKVSKPRAFKAPATRKLAVRSFPKVSSSKRKSIV